MDDFSSKTACVTPQNSPIDDWMSFPVKRSQKFPRNLPIRVSDFWNVILIESQIKSHFDILWFIKTYSFNCVQSDFLIFLNHIFGKKIPRIGNHFPEFELMVNPNEKEFYNRVKRNGKRIQDALNKRFRRSS